MIKPGGIVFVIACTFGGYIGLGGKMEPILKAAPLESVIIVGAAIGAFIIANTMHTIKSTLHYMKALIKPESHNKQSYLELLTMMFMIFKMARSKGWLALEPHIEDPHNSDLFKNFPEFSGNHHATTFLCDYLRIISLGTENPHEIGDLLDAEIDTIEHEKQHASHATQTLADGLPALGIVAAVLGIIKTMASINEPPEILGKMIGGALVGTFLGVWLSYGFFAPIANAMAAKADSEVMYYKVMRITLIAFLQGAAPQVAIEFGRKVLDHEKQPSFVELEEACNNLPTI